MIVSLLVSFYALGDSLLSDTIHIVISKLVSIVIALQQGINMYWTHRINNKVQSQANMALKDGIF